MNKSMCAALVAAAAFYFTDPAVAGSLRHVGHKIHTVETVTQLTAPATPVFATPVAASVMAPVQPVYGAPLPPMMGATMLAAPMIQPVMQPMVQQVVQPALHLPPVPLERPAAVTVHGIFDMPPTVYMGARIAVPVSVEGAVVVPAPWQ